MNVEITVVFDVSPMGQVRHLIEGSDNAVERAGALALIQAHIALMLKADAPKGKK
jgi:hypothetical protein